MMTPRRTTRRTVLAGGLLTGVGVIAAACGSSSSGSGSGAKDQKSDIRFADEPVPTTALSSDDPAALSTTLSSLLFSAATVAVVTAEDALDAFAPAAQSARVPILLSSATGAADELKRLGVTQIVTAQGADLSALDTSAKAVELDPAAADLAKQMPKASVSEQTQPITLLVSTDQEDGPARILAQAMVTAAGGTIVEAAEADPRATSDSVKAVLASAGKDSDGASGVLALGGSAADNAQLAEFAAVAASAPELPGGGQLAFPGRRMIAAYGSPGVPSLGVLGEQPLEEAIDLAKQLAADYEPYADGDTIVPAFEIITTVASASAGKDGDYSEEIDPAVINEWVDAAGKAGVYCVLDLQPGRTDFLTQAKLYEDILKKPHVGLALDSEWRLKENQVHLRQIGTVTAAEVNTTTAWLADLVKKNKLPQKVLILHQFHLGMITERETLDASRPELAMVLHADGHGTPGEKMSTWDALRQNLPEGIRMAWKNFYDEDTPMFTPEQTFQVEPKPWFVSYQ